MYARNLADTGKMIYNSEITLGESSYLWMLILAMGHLFNIDPIVYTFLVNIIIQICFYCVAFILNQYILQKKQRKNPELISFLISSSTIVQPQMIWLFNNGMATGITIIFMELASLVIVKKKEQFLNIIFPLLFLSRGESFIFIFTYYLLEIIGLARKRSVDEILKSIKSIIGVFFTVIGYLLFHYLFNHQLFPNTFYLKVNLFSNLSNLGQVFRIENVETILLSFIKLENITIFITILLGIIIVFSQKIDKDERLLILALLSVIAYGFFTNQGFPQWNLTPYHLKYWGFVYPILYQMVCLECFKRNLRKLDGVNLQALVNSPNLGKVLLLIGLVSGLFAFPLEQDSFKVHVYEIRNQHEEIGIWLNHNIPENESIACHDAGAIKYFSSRIIIDIWGLNNNDIAQIYRTIGKETSDMTQSNKQLILEAEIWKYLLNQDVGYLLTRVDLFLNLQNTTLHPELTLIREFKAPSGLTIGNDTMRLFQISF